MKGIAVGAAALAVLGLCGCGDLAGEDWLIAERVSPDGSRIARLWCADLCDVPGRTVLTISAAARPVESTPGVAGFPPTGTLPEEDSVAVFWVAEDAGADAPTRMRWKAADALEIEDRCLSVDRRGSAPFAWKGVRVSFRDSATAGCR